MNTVHGKGMVTENIEIVETLYNPLSVFLHRIEDIGHTFRNVDVVPRARRKLRSAVFEGFIGQCKGRMEPHHRRLHRIFLLLTSADKFGIFGNRLFHLSLAVPVGNFIAKVHPQTKLFGNIRKGKKAPRCFAVACVMVKNRRYTVFNTVDQRRVSAVFCVL